MKKLKESEAQLVAILVVLAILGIVYSKQIKREIQGAELVNQEIEKYEETIRPFYDIALGAKAFAIYDVENKTFLYKKNAEAVMPLASLVKVASVLTAIDYLPEDYVVKIEKESLGQIGDNGLLVDERWTRDELFKFLLITSSNDAVNQIAKDVGRIINPEAEKPEEIFVQKMDEKMKELGFRNFEFYNETGLDLENGVNGAYGSARDMAKLFAYANEMHPDIFGATRNQNMIISSFDKEHDALNTNPITNQINGLVSSKTGFTNMSGGNLVVEILNKNDVKMVVIVMGSTFDERFTDVNKISEALN